MTDDLEASGNFLQNLGDVFAQAGQFGSIAIAAGADNLRFMHDGFARQMRRHRFADRRFAGFACGGVGRFRLGPRRTLLRPAFFEVFKAQFKLLDLGGQPFRGLPELSPPQDRKIEAQRFNLRIRHVECGVAFGQLRTQGGVLGLQNGQGVFHRHKVATLAATYKREWCHTGAVSGGNLGARRPCGHPPVDPFEQHR